MTQTAVLASVAETNGLKTKQSKGVVEALMAVACDQIKQKREFHQGALCFQGQAGLKDSEGLCDGEA